MDPSVVSVLAMNKLKGNLKVNVINAPAYGINKKDTLQDIALITGAQIINEDLGDTMDIVNPDFLGRCSTALTYDNETIIKVDSVPSEVYDIIDEITNSLANDKLSPGEVILKERRLARLSGKVAVVKVGANSEIELKEKSDRVEDAICATKAAIKEGYVDGGGVALRDISNTLLKEYSSGDPQSVLLNAIKAPYNTILENAGFDTNSISLAEHKQGINVLNGAIVNMSEEGIIDPLTVTKEALKNAASVAVTILSTDCVINNLRIESLNGSGR
jgi:chaperonin GroEL